MALLVLRENYIYMDIVDAFEMLDKGEAKSLGYAHNSHANILSQFLTPTYFIGNILATKWTYFNMVSSFRVKRPLHRDYGYIWLALGKNFSYMEIIDISKIFDKDGVTSVSNVHNSFPNPLS